MQRGERGLNRAPAALAAVATEQRQRTRGCRGGRRRQRRGPDGRFRPTGAYWEPIYTKDPFAPGYTSITDPNSPDFEVQLCNVRLVPAAADPAAAADSAPDIVRRLQLVLADQSNPASMSQGGHDSDDDGGGFFNDRLEEPLLWL